MKSLLITQILINKEPYITHASTEWEYTEQWGY
jgi:hypothetical protein